MRTDDLGSEFRGDGMFQPGFVRKLPLLSQAEYEEYNARIPLITGAKWVPLESYQAGRKRGFNPVQIFGTCKSVFLLFASLRLNEEETETTEARDSRFTLLNEK
jgi:hypothetical protein